MKLVEFTRHWNGYNPGERADKVDEIAEHIVATGAGFIIEPIEPELVDEETDDSDEETGEGGDEESGDDGDEEAPRRNRRNKS